MTAKDLGSSPSGLLTASYLSDRDALIFRSPRAKLWKHTTHEACISCFCEIADAFAKDATVDDLLWIARTIDNFDNLGDIDT